MYRRVLTGYTVQRRNLRPSTETVEICFVIVDEIITGKIPEKGPVMTAYKCSVDCVVLGSNPGWTGPSSSCHLILVCVNYDLNGSLHINSRLHARLNNQLSHPIQVNKIERVM